MDGNSRRSRRRHSEKIVDPQRDSSQRQGKESTYKSHDELKETSERQKRWEQMRDTTEMTSFSNFDDMAASSRAEPTRSKNVQDSIPHKDNGPPQRHRDILSNPSYAAPTIAQENIVGLFTPAREGNSARSYLEPIARIEEATSVLSYTEPISHITDANVRIPKRPWTHEPALRGFRNHLKADIIKIAKMLMQDERSKDKRFNAVREVEKASIEYNCHSYVFTNGKGGCLTDANARMILEHNGYKQVASYDGDTYPNVQKLNIRKGDVVAYYNWPGQLEPPHTGVVSKVKGNQIFVKSKWGIFGLNEHPIDVIPEAYPKLWTIYHTDRPGGRLLHPDV